MGLPLSLRTDMIPTSLAKRLLVLGVFAVLLAACSSIPFIGGEDGDAVDEAGDETGAVEDAGSTGPDAGPEIDLINARVVDLLTRLDALQAKTPEPDPRIDDLLAQVQALIDAPPPTVTLTDENLVALRAVVSAPPTPQPTPTPQPIPTPDARVDTILSRLTSIDTKVGNLEGRVYAATPTPSPTPTPTPRPLLIASFTGSGSLLTTTFRMERSPWELAWVATSTPAARLWVRLHSNTGAIISDVLDNTISGGANGKTLVYGSVGTFYLEIAQGPLDAQGSWKLSVTELTP